MLTHNQGRELEPSPATPPIELPPDSALYRLKSFLLGPPLETDQAEHERLGKTTGLAIFASDNLSSSAYATEEILRVLVPAVGVAAFSLVVPVSVAMLVVLAFLILSYRQTINAYPTAGGAYMVTRDNFGERPALVAGVALLTDYILTVAVSTAAGSAALASAFPALDPYVVPISLGFITLTSYGNLRGVRESGRLFAVPTYFFMANMLVLLVVGLARLFFAELPKAPHGQPGMLHLGKPGDGLLMGATLYVVLRAFASGGAAVTGVEAISNGVPAFKEPSPRNARTTLVMMGFALGTMFMGLSVLASKLQAVPYEKGTPTVLAQVGRLVYDGGALGHALFYSLQAGTMLILVLAANTGFAGFPRLASFQATDNFLPRQLTQKGHRLVYSNGIIFLAVSAMVLVVLTGAKVDRLIPLYALGVFTGFTFSQAGMFKHHLTHREPRWRYGLVVNGLGALLSAVVTVVIAVTKFTHGAWIIIAVIPVMVVVLVRLNRQYESEDEQLEKDVPTAVTAPILRRHVVLVFIDHLDLAAARAIQYARTLTPDELRAVHFALEEREAQELAEAWGRLGLSRVPLELVECPDRRLAHSAVMTVARVLGEGDTEVSVLIPDRKYNGLWRRVLHDETAESISEAVSALPHANVTMVPFHLGRRQRRERSPETGADGERAEAEAPESDERDSSDGGAGDGATTGQGSAAVAPRIDASAGNGQGSGPATVPIGQVRWRSQVRVHGRVSAIRVQPRAGVPSLECTLVDETGGLCVVFLGRRRVAGVKLGSRLEVEGIVGEFHGQLAILNPLYRLLGPK